MISDETVLKYYNCPCSNPNDSKDAAKFAKEPLLDISIPASCNEQFPSLEANSITKQTLPPGPLTSAENEAPDYVSELHQLLSEQDDEVENAMLVSDETSRTDSRRTMLDKRENSSSTNSAAYFMCAFTSPKIKNFVCLPSLTQA